MEKIRSIAEKTETLTGYKTTIVNNVQELSAYSEENKASNEEVTGNIEQILSEITLVSQHCEKISHMATDLDKAIAYFKA